eukprot:358188-Chlamydomonas_euryale.AAC.4
MIINNSKGQTSSKVGMYPPVPCFSHGQFHFATSRMGSSDTIHMHAHHPQPKEGEPGDVYTGYVVYKDTCTAKTAANLQTNQTLACRPGARLSGAEWNGARRSGAQWSVVEPNSYHMYNKGCMHMGSMSINGRSVL